MDGKRERRTYVRHPLTMYVDLIQFDPEIYAGDEVRTAYDLELTEYDVMNLYKQLKHRVESGTPGTLRLRVIGRQI